MTRTLVAGVGNVLRRDDGFGVRVLERLRRGRLGNDPSVRFWESGIAGVSLVQELLDGYDVLVVLDAVDRGGSPGEVFVLEPDLERVKKVALEGVAVDLHEAGPEGVLVMAEAAGVLPKRVVIVGAQIVSCDLGDELSAPVAAAVERAAERAERILEQRAVVETNQVSLADEILQILYWLRGEGLSKDASAIELERWLSLPAEAIEPALRRLGPLGLVDETEGRFRLTEEGWREGGRRFADEFSDMTKPGHGECGDPDCECYQTGDPADCRHNVA